MIALLLVVLLAFAAAVKGSQAVTRVRWASSQSPVAPAAPAASAAPAAPASLAASASASAVFRIIADVKEELLDVADGFIFAKGNSERIDHAIYCLDRHKGVLGTATAALLIRNRFLSAKLANNAASASIKSMRAQEAAKWGTRKFSGL